MKLSKSRHSKGQPMPTDPDPVRLAKLADERLAGLSIPSADRPAARRAAVAMIQREEAEAAASRDAQGEALAERRRVSAVVRVGRDLSRPRQALRLAMSMRITEGEAKSILGTLPTDADAPDTALALPDPGTFGTPAAVGERQRILAVFGSPAAQGRFTSTCALALSSADATPPEAIIAILTGLPVEAPARSGAEILAERAEGLGEFGGEALATGSEPITEGWAKAVKAANQAIGAIPAATQGSAQQPAVVAGPFDAPPILGARA
jgi:hypothetical protein